MLPGGAVYPQRGKIGFADPSFSQDTGSFLVRAVMPNPKFDLRPGMFVTARVIGAMRPNAIVVPQLAVQQGSNGHLVYVVNASDAAEIRPVVVGDYYGDKDIVIQQGLAKGDRVVVDGVMKVVPGQPVKIVDAGSAAATPPPRRPTPRRSSGPMFTHFFIDRPILSSVISILFVLAGAGGDVGRRRSSSIPELAPPSVSIGGELPGRHRGSDRQPGRLADRGAAQRRRQPALLLVDQLVLRQRRRSTSCSSRAATPTSTRSTSRTASARRSRCCRKP